MQVILTFSIKNDGYKSTENPNVNLRLETLIATGTA
jgi:hypothetical protein